MRAMAYRFKLNEPFDKGFRRIADEQIDLAEEVLRKGEDRVAAVHEARKCIKRIRALLKLLGPAIGVEAYRRENRRLRDIARLLSGHRDADVLGATAARFTSAPSAQVRKAALTIAGEAGQGVTREQSADAIEKAIAALEAARAALGEIEFRGRGFKAIRRGLERTYRDGRRAMMAAYDAHHDEAFHEWRKAVQAHWRHMLLLENGWAQVMTARAALAKETAELLGEDHDLYLLIEKASSAASAAEGEGGGLGEWRDLVAAARQRQQQIRRELAAKGEALYAEGATEFADRIRHYWKAAKAARRLARQPAEPGAAPRPGRDKEASERAASRTPAAVPAAKGSPKPAAAPK